MVTPSLSAALEPSSQAAISPALGAALEQPVDRFQDSRDTEARLLESAVQSIGSRRGRREGRRPRPHGRRVPGVLVKQVTMVSPVQFASEVLTQHANVFPPKLWT
jgi:hypothetical protein